MDGKTALHLCFGYAAVIKTQKPSGYSFLPELEAAAVDQISIEAAQPGLDPAILAHLPSKEILYGVDRHERSGHRATGDRGGPAA